MAKIKLLPEYVIKQIAAGEVIERPASVIKELIENSIDAKAKNIEISIRNGGKSFISITDDGEGIAKEDLLTAVKKHATSKLDDYDLYNIQTMGFRGEALSSICYVGKLLIKSKAINAEDAFEIAAENDDLSEVKLSNLLVGTYIEVRDLFFNIPARLKFLGSDNNEANAIYKIVNHIALGNPDINFKVFHNGKKVIEYKVELDKFTENNDYYENIQQLLAIRANTVINKDFINNAYFFNKSSAEFNMYGYVSIPTFNSTQSSQQYLYVNKRFVKTSFLFGAIKAAYSGVIERGRYPMVVLFIDIDPKNIDINVSPSKTEIKFKDTEVIRNYLISSIKNVLADSKNQKTSTFISQQLVNAGLKNNFSSKVTDVSHEAINDLLNNSSINHDKNYNNLWLVKEEQYSIEKLDHNNLYEGNSNTSHSDLATTINSQIDNDNAIKYVELADDALLKNTIKENSSISFLLRPKLGYAKGQYHQNWIIAENENGFVIVDQHAAHERINQEKLYNQYISNQVITQATLLPEVIDINKIDLENLLNIKHYLIKLGINIDKFGDSSIIIREYPSVLGDNVNFKQLINDILVDLKEVGSPESFLEKLNDVIAKIACHSSIRSGDNMSGQQMNALLREIEKTENSTQCPHGRPTYIELSLSDIERLFKRK
ncbi:DNA mismatch repair endonuclease MutL [Rickettsiales bacterium LUAb2]